ncbi:MAG TPA: WhiB family transcriptional regulator [Trebonia sp.]|jgi:WhiB family redox-sensing transcriptional regulator|nr:WhiB family transcriptional regulator [Trebonia sp.]
MTEYATDWREAGACLAADPDLFFPIGAGSASGTETTRALRICDGCPVKRQCLEFAMRNGEANGIWGGTTPEERIRVLRGRGRRPGRRTWREPSVARVS